MSDIAERSAVTVLAQAQRLAAKLRDNEPCTPRRGVTISYQSGVILGELLDLLINGTAANPTRDQVSKAIYERLLADEQTEPVIEPEWVLPVAIAATNAVMDLLDPLSGDQEGTSG